MRDLLAQFAITPPLSMHYNNCFNEPRIRRILRFDAQLLRFNAPRFEYSKRFNNAGINGVKFCESPNCIK